MGTLKKLLTNSPNESIVIYCRSRSKTRTHRSTTPEEWGATKQVFYHGGLEAEQKKQILEDWKNEIHPIMGRNQCCRMGRLNK